MNINLKNRTAIVTGGAQGIGYVIAEKLLNEGVRVSIWDNDDEHLEKVSKTFSKDFKKNFLAVLCDVSNEADVKKAMNSTLHYFGSVDILVANAGIVSTKKVADLNENEWERVFEVNAKGAFLCAKEVAEEFKKNKFGRIIIASSFAAIIPSIGSSAYAASKSAVNSLVRVLAGELGPWGITVNSYAPGMIPSNMSKIDSLTEQRKEMMLDSLSIREWGKAEDIASLVIFLASDQARYITGSFIDASGGKFSVQFGKLAYEDNED